MTSFRLLGNLGLLGLSLWLVGCGAAPLSQVYSEGERLKVARDLVERGQCLRAVELLKLYISTNMGSAEVDEAVYLLGYCHLRTKDWVSATIEFERLLRDYPNGDSTASAAFRLGEAHFGQSRPADFDQEFTHKAIEQWRRYLRLYPGHWLNGEAERAVARARHRLATKLAGTGELYLKLDLLQPARIYYQQVADEYADTALLGEAILGLAEIDAAEGKRTEALDRLRRLEQEFSGRPIGDRARRLRERLEKQS